MQRLGKELAADPTCGFDTLLLVSMKFTPQDEMSRLQSLTHCFQTYFLFGTAFANDVRIHGCGSGKNIWPKEI